MTAPYVGSAGEAPELVPEFPEGVVDGPPVPSASSPVEVPTAELPERIEEVVAERTATSDVWLNADGFFIRTEYSEPKYFDAGGRFELIDSTLVPDGEKGWFRSAANSWVARFGPVTAEGGGVEVTRGADRVAFTPSVQPGVVVQPQVGSGDEANVVTYLDVWKNVDIRYIVTPVGVKEDIVVKAADVSPDFVFDLDTSEPVFVDGASKGAVLPADGSGLTIAAPEVLSKDGDPLDEAARPSVQLRTAESAATPTGPGESPDSTDAPPVPLVAGKEEYVLSVDAAWLASQTVFPLIIDPTIGVTQADHVVFQKSHPSGGLSECVQGPTTCNTLQTGWNAGSFWRRSVAFYDLTDFTENAWVVSNATVTLTPDSGTTPNRTIYIHDPVGAIVDGRTPVGKRGGGGVGEGGKGGGAHGGYCVSS